MQPIAASVQPPVYRPLRVRNKMNSMFTASKLPLSFLLALPLLGISSQMQLATPREAQPASQPQSQPAAQPNSQIASSSSAAPEYTADAQLKLPEHYREWLWLTSDFHTATDPANVQAGEHRLFNNVFVDPESYKAFLATGSWPDKTMLVFEQRIADDMGSKNPNHKGTAQSTLLGVGVHVKDESRFPGKWAFFGFHGGKTTAAMIPVTAACYTCHASQGAVDTTFIQYYPTLLPIAKNKSTLNPSYQQQSETPPPPAK
jgi:hypothetical protein